MLWIKRFLFITVVVAYIFAAGFTPKPTVSDEINTRAEQFVMESEKLFDASESFRMGQIGYERLFEQYQNTRKAYKQIELFAAFSFPEYVESHINGAPLLKSVKFENRAEVEFPMGLQVIDELMTPEISDIDKSQLILQVRELNNYAIKLAVGLSTQKYTEDEIFAAIRLQMIRLYTHGISGFDTPGTLWALPDAVWSLESAIRFLEIFYDEHNKKMPEKLAGNLQSAMDYIGSPGHTFDTFDRMHFTRAYFNPILHSLSEEHSLENYRHRFPTALNFNADNLFSDDFLNPYFYSELKESDDSDALRKLGESLFHDRNLSKNGVFSCGTCHRPEMAFTDGLPKSKSRTPGISTERNSPTLLNAVYADRFFADMSALTLEQQAEHVIFNDIEFATNYSDILKSINQLEKYQKAAREVFNTSALSRENISSALASYVISLRSYNSEFDRYARAET